MFGDAFSPYLIGALSDSFKPLIASSPALDPYGSAVTLRQSTMMDRILTYELTPQEYDREFRALEYSLFSCCFFQARPFFPLKSNTFNCPISGNGGIFLLCSLLVCDL